MLIRSGNAGSNTAKDHIHVTKNALAQLPRGFRSGRKVMIRTDSPGGTHEFLDWVAHPRRNVAYSVGFPFHGAVEAVLLLVPRTAWSRAYKSDGVERDGAWVADITGMLDLSSWPAVCGLYLGGLLFWRDYTGACHVSSATTAALRPLRWPLLRVCTRRL